MAIYANKWLPKENVIIYEGPDDKKNYNFSSLLSDKIDQLIFNLSGSLIGNGDFFGR